MIKIPNSKGYFMKKIFLLSTAFVVSLLAADNMNQYSYEYQKKNYEQAKGEQQQNKHQYKRGDQSGDGQQKQYRYGQNGGQHKGGGRH